jgi:hypothetical protein
MISSNGSPKGTEAAAAATPMARLRAALLAHRHDGPILGLDGEPDDLLMSVRVLREDLWRNQYRPLAVYNHDEDWTEAAGKLPSGKAWQERARLDPPEAVHAIAANARNTGLLCDNLRAVDIDISDADMVAGVRFLAEGVLGSGALVRYRDNSPRILMLYRAAVPGQKKRRVAASKEVAVEVLGHGQQFVAYGTHKTGARLLWEAGRSPDVVALADLPEVDEEQITKFLGACCDLLGIEPVQAEPPALHATQNTAVPPADREVPLTIEDIRAVLAAIGPDTGHEMWLRVGAAVYSVDNGPDGFMAFNEWSMLNPAQYDLKSARRQWNNFAASPLKRLSAGTLIHMAKEADPAFVTPSLRAFNASKRADPRLDDEAKAEAKVETPARQDVFELLTDVQMIEMPPPNWLIKDLLIQNTVAALYGPPASFKSFLALDIALSLAHGTEWYGRKLPETGVAYVAAEGGNGLGKRIHAWKRHRGITGSAKSLVAMRVAVNLADKGEVEKLLRTLRQHSQQTGIIFKLVVLDTFARCSVGVDENSSREIGMVLDGVIRLQEALGCTVLLVHHTGKDLSRGMRGSNRMKGDIDTTIVIDRAAGSSQVVLDVEKQKDAEELRDVRFEMLRVDLPLRAGEEPQSSLVPVMGSAVGTEISREKADVISVATVMSLDEVHSLSSVITGLGWKRGTVAYARIKDALPLTPEGVVVRTNSGLRRVVRTLDGSAHGSLTVSELKA